MGTDSDSDSKIVCSSDNYPSFLLSTTGFLVMGFILGHISQSSWKLFRILTKFYIYLCLPCMAFSFAEVISEANSTVPGFLKKNPIHIDVLINASTSSIYWIGVVGVFGAIAVYKRDKSFLLHGALTAQFIIHGNDLTFGSKLLDSSCRNETKDPKIGDGRIDFIFLELPAIFLAFLIFLPLTNGIVMMSKRSACFRSFFLGVIKQAAKMSLSYLALAVSVAVILGGINKTLLTEVSDFGMDIITFSKTLMTLLVGVYLYHLCMNMGVRMESVSIKYCIFLTLATNIGFTLVSLCGNIVCSQLKRCTPWNPMSNSTTAAIFISRSCTPSSLYLQYYILKHTNEAVNYTLSYVGSTFVGTILMYVIMLVVSAFSDNNEQNNPVYFYNKTQRWAVLILNILFMILPAMMFIRRRQSKLRRMLLFILLSYLSNQLIQAAYFFTVRDIHNSTTKFEAVISVGLMANFIFSNVMVCFTVLYQYYSFVGRNLKLILCTVLSGSLVFPTILHSAVILIGNISAFENNSDVILFLNNTDTDIPYGSGSYCFLSVLSLVFFFAVMCLYFRQPSNTTLTYVSEETPLLSNFSRTDSTSNYDNDDREKFTAVKIFFCYTFCTTFIGFFWVVCRLAKWIMRIIEPVELVATVMTDLSGFVFTLVFCITPGHMNVEFERLMYYPRRLKYLLQKLKRLEEEVDVNSLTVLDVDRCRRFILYHRQTFINLYPMCTNEDLLEFKGSTLIDFLLDTEVADCQGEAGDICKSYLKGGIFVRKNGFGRVRQVTSIENSYYTFKDLEDLPDFRKLSSQRCYDL